jgi:hypothetical protein
VRRRDSCAYRRAKLTQVPRGSMRVSRELRRHLGDLHLGAADVTLVRNRLTGVRARLDSTNLSQPEDYRI